jgi:hypothetical protein
MSIRRSALRRGQKLSGRKFKIQDRGTSKALTVPKLAEDTRFPTEEGTEVDPLEVMVEDPETGEEKPALIYIPE